MKIARIGNLYQPVPAKEYGGTQRSMAQITAFQAALCAHDVTLYAASDSEIIPFTHDIATKLGLAAEIDSTGRTVSVTNRDGRKGSVRLQSAGISSIGYENSSGDEVAFNRRLFGELLRDDRAERFDLIHCHARRFMAENIIPAGMADRALVHQHNAVLEKSYRHHPYPLICISHDQAELMRRTYHANVIGVVHHGLDSYTHTATKEDAGYAAWIGRFLEDKGAHRAIQIAETAGTPLVMAGMVYERNAKSQSHFDHDIKPYIDVFDPTFLDRTASMTAHEVRVELARVGAATHKKNPVIFVGPANDAQKQTLYQNAVATLFPISWAEPFGRVMIESMACGTPVIAYKSLGSIDCGSVAEVIDHGKTGFAVSARDEKDGVAQAASLLKEISSLDRSTVRQIFDDKWTSERVARQLDVLYARFLPTSSAHTTPERRLTTMDFS